MKLLHTLLALGSVVLVLVAFACSGPSSKGPGEEPDAMLLNPEDVATSEDAGDANPGLSTFMRFGHLVPGLERISVCVLAPGSTMWTPLFTPPADDLDAASEAAPPDAPSDVRGDAVLDALADGSARDGGAADGGPSEGAAPPDAHAAPDSAVLDGGVSDAAANLDPLTMTRYLRLPAAGTFELAILPAGSGSCTNAYFKQAVTLDSDKHSTVVLVQTEAGTLASPMSYLGEGVDGAVPFGLLTFTDEPSSSPQAARTRLASAVTPAGADAASRGALAVAVLDSTADLVPLALAVPDDQASSPSQVAPVVDVLGYHDGPAVPGLLAFRIRASGDAGVLPWTSVAADLGLKNGSAHTGFILSGATDPYEVLWCNDLSQEPVLTDCLVVLQ